MYQQSRDLLIITIILLPLIVNHQEMRCSASVQVHHQSTQNDYLATELPQEKMDQLKIPKDQTLIVRLPSNTLLKYTSYKDVSILHFRIPPDTRTAFFTFKAFEESKSAFLRKCRSRDVTLHLKASSYPVISPENITFPRNFLNGDQRFKIYDLQFQSNEEQQRITVEGPQVGNWFAVSFVSWTDPSNDRIEQQGLAASCDTLLLAEMSVSRFHPIIINNGQVHNSTLTSNSDEQNITTKQNLTENDGTKKFNYTKSSATTSSPSAFASTTATSSTSTSSSATGTATASATNASASASAKLKRTPPSQSHAKTKSSNKNNGNSTTNNEIIYKFYVPRNIGVATARITIAQVCLQCPDVGFHIQANALPSYTSSTRKNYESNYIHSTIIKPNQTGEISIEFYVQPNTWHYALLKFENAVGDASSSLTETDAKLFDRLATSTSDLRLRNMPTAFTYGQRQRIQQLQQQQRAHRRQNATDGVSEANETIWYHLVYSLRIDFQEPVNEDENADSDTNISNNKENGPENMSTSIKTSPKMAATSETDTNNGTKEAGNNTTANSKSNAWKPVIFRDMEFYPLLRQTYREFFMFDYDLVPDSNGTVPTVLNLTAGIPAGFAFEIGEVYDIGGTLSFAVSMKHGLKGSNELKSLPTMTSPTERSGILAEKLIGRPFGQDDDVVEKEENKALPRSNQTIIVCMHHGEPGEPTWPDKCRYGRKLYPASSIVNNTDSNTSTGLVHVPFPESGQWYVTMGLYCHGAETAARVTIIDSVKDFVKKYGNMLDEMRAPCACANSANYYLTCINDRKCLASMN
ncbi:uncharacterized protein LOC119676045, partial [Teleopsis dalmanni]|uniref:uncharacterized protein LOC119676045 n=1 Tax=Teleopsis dalmanni TaxID=139649 RepID=UPI0018CE64C7